MQIQATYVTNLSPEYQAIFKQLQAKEMENLLRQQTQNKVNTAVQRIKFNSVNQLAEFQAVVDSAVAQLNCDAACVSTCTTAALNIDAKARCLETCLCYATPAVTVPATPAAPATPAVPATPVIANAEPVVADAAAV